MFGVKWRKRRSKRTNTGRTRRRWTRRTRVGIERRITRRKKKREEASEEKKIPRSRTRKAE